MKKNFRVATVISLVIFIVISCSKQRSVESGQQSQNFDVAVAKEWYYGTFKKSAAWLDYNSAINGKKLPDWEEGRVIQAGEMSIVEFPFLKEKPEFSIAHKTNLNKVDAERISNASLSRVLFIRQKSGAIQVRELQYIPDIEYLTAKNFDISNNRMGNIDSNFSGSLVIKNWKGDELSRQIIQHGKIRGVIRMQIINTMGRPQSCPIGSIQVDEYARDCETHLYGDGLFTSQCGEWYPTGNQWCFEEEDMEGSGCMDPNSTLCTCSLLEVCGGGGGEDPGPTPIIMNDVIDPCIRNSVNHVVSAGCRNQITNFINTTFSTSQQFHIQFSDGVLTGINASLDAKTVTQPLINLIEIKSTITFNTSLISNASKEYIAATVLHEVVHSWIDLKFQNSIENESQHQLMASANRFNMLRDALMEMFPALSLQDATDLTWGGMFNTTQFNNLPSAERERIVQKNKDFRNHTLGTPCTP